MLQISKFKEIAYLESIYSCQINKTVIKNYGSSDKWGKSIGSFLWKDFVFDSQRHRLCCTVHLLGMTDVFETLEVLRHNAWPKLDSQH